MYKVGITGGIGSGKTTVCKLFEVLGIPVFYADLEAKKIMTADELLISDITETFGAESYFEDGRLNNKHISGIVFNNAEKLKKLNAIVHPAVFRAFENWEALVDPKVPYTLKEAALLFESGSYKLCDTSILVTAPHQMKIKRVMHRDQVDEAQVEARMNKQWSDEEKLKMTDHLIRNDEQSSLIEQVWKLHQYFLTESKAKTS